jgi:hypothetical protein
MRQHYQQDKRRNQWAEAALAAAIGLALAFILFTYL